jgi:hypothetical protein
MMSNDTVHVDIIFIFISISFSFSLSFPFPFPFPFPNSQKVINTSLQNRHLPSEIGITYAVGKCRVLKIHFWKHRKSVRTVKVMAANMSLAIAGRIRGCVAVRTARARHRRLLCARLIFTSPPSSAGLWRWRLPANDWMEAAQRKVMARMLTTCENMKGLGCSVTPSAALCSSHIYEDPTQGENANDLT